MKLNFNISYNVNMLMLYQHFTDIEVEKFEDFDDFLSEIDDRKESEEGRS